MMLISAFKPKRMGSTLKSSGSSVSSTPSPALTASSEDSRSEVRTATGSAISSRSATPQPRSATPQPDPSRGNNEIDPRTAEVYTHLMGQIDRAERLSGEEVTRLCAAVSDLGPNEAKTVHELICYHHTRHAGNKVVKNRAFPYDGMVESGKDVVVHPGDLPPELLLVVRMYVELVTDHADQADD
jgi:hypothetical protein